MKMAKRRNRWILKQRANLALKLKEFTGKKKRR